MNATSWRLVTAGAAVVTIASAVFAVGAAATSDDDGGGGSAAPVPAGGTASESTTATPVPGLAVSIAEFAFDPSSLSVAAGSTVTFTNNHQVVHNIRSVDGSSMSSPDLAEGDTYSVSLDDPGTVDYICGIHDFMQGSITVTP